MHQRFYQLFDQLLHKTNRKIAQEAPKVLTQIRSFQLDIMGMQFARQVPINRPSDILNDILDDAAKLIQICCGCLIIPAMPLYPITT